MHSKHRKTLATIFTDPVSARIRWRDIEALFRALGGELVEGRGSRVTVFLGDAKATFHRPHPRPDTDKGAVRAVRRFLLQAGVRPKRDSKGRSDP
jgi:HicA toxin of bacterial toxin-antitoxin,